MNTLKNDFLMILLLGLGVTVVFLFPGYDKMMIHPMTNELALKPDQMMLRAMENWTEKPDASVDYVEKAIESMRILERDADQESNLVIEAAISDLKLLEKELISEGSTEDRINQAFLNALNSLAFAQLRESEAYIETHNYTASKIALGYATKHLDCALKFSKGKVRMKERELKNSINAIALSASFKEDKTMGKIDVLVNDMNAIVLH